MFNKICIIGLGYIGLPTSAMFASHGIDVVGVDVNKKVVDSLNEGKIIIEEPFLPELIKDVVNKKKLIGSTKPVVADAFIIAVPTPVNEDKTAGMEYVISATKSILSVLKKGDLVVLESTSPPKTIEDIVVPILAESGFIIGEEVFVSHSPERVLPGKILEELVNNDRIVGGINDKSSEITVELYKTFVKGNIYITDSTTAEMCKLMENTFRDVNIALANELAIICEKMGINAWEVVKLSNMHPRVNLHSPGPGVGGHCIAVDPWFIKEKDPENSKIISLARETNDNMPSYVFEKSLRILDGKKNVTILGITYKPDVDDMRESPIVHLINLFEKAGINVKIIDPHIEKHNISLTEGLKNSDLIILGVNHKEFLNFDFDKASNLVSSKNILDTRNFFNKNLAENAGFKYFLLGNGEK